MPKYRAEVTKSISKLGKNVMMGHMENYRKKNEDEFGNPLKNYKKGKRRSSSDREEYSSDGSFDRQLLEEIKEVQWHFKKNLIDPKNIGGREKKKNEVQSFENAR